MPDLSTIITQYNSTDPKDLLQVTVSALALQELAAKNKVENYVQHILEVL